MAGTGNAQLRERDKVLLRVEDLVVEFPVGRREVAHAVSGISFDVAKGETLGLVGESGCGKSTTGRAILQYPRPKSGSVRFEGEELTTLRANDLRARRLRLQMIFQDPTSSLNPRRKAGRLVAEGLEIWGGRTKTEVEERVNELLTSVGLDPDAVRERRPHQFSGGQCQRLSIARALALDPELIVCDEPVSALDVSVQAQILNLLEDLKKKFGVTLLFISHDLSVVKNISDRVMVMYLGKVCEIGSTETVFASPSHPYTQALFASVPEPDPDVDPTQAPTLGGELPSPITPPSGCRFRTRCPLATERCIQEEPQVREVAADHFVACHHAGMSLEDAEEIPLKAAESPTPAAT